MWRVGGCGESTLSAVTHASAWHAYKFHPFAAALLNCHQISCSSKQLTKCAPSAKTKVEPRSGLHKTRQGRQNDLSKGIKGGRKFVCIKKKEDLLEVLKIWRSDL